MPEPGGPTRVTMRPGWSDRSWRISDSTETVGSAASNSGAMTVAARVSSHQGDDPR